MKHSPNASSREFMTLNAIAGFSLATSPMRLTAHREAAGRTPRVVNADEALRRLVAGNDRFVKGQCLSPQRSPKDVRAVAEAQYPEAVVVGCADSRVPPEILFDVGVGNIFVVRVADNVIGGAGVSVEGSIEYAVVELKVPLIVLLGHSGCGAALLRPPLPLHTGASGRLCVLLSLTQCTILTPPSAGRPRADSTGHFNILNNFGQSA